MTVLPTDPMTARHDGPRRRAHRAEMTNKWKADVRAALKMRDVSEQWLADQITERRKLPRPMKRDTINKMLRRQTHSSLVEDVSAILGLQPPMIATPPAPSAKTQRAIDFLVEAPEEVVDAVLLLAGIRGKTD